MSFLESVSLLTCSAIVNHSSFGLRVRCPLAKDAIYGDHLMSAVVDSQVLSPRIVFLPTRRLEDRIKELAARAVECDNPQEFEEAVSELREALHTHAVRLRKLAAEKLVQSVEFMSSPHTARRHLRAIDPRFKWREIKKSDRNNR